MVFLKEFFEKKNKYLETIQQTTKSMLIYPVGKEFGLGITCIVYSCQPQDKQMCQAPG